MNSNPMVKTLTSKKKSKWKETKAYRRIHANRYVWLSFLVSLVICIVVELCYSMWPFGDISILRMDLYHQYGPLFGELYDRIVNGQSLQYSWQSGGGGIFLGNFFNYLSSPLSILVLIFGHKNIPQAVGCLIFLKGCLSSATMTYYLKESKQFQYHNAFSAGLGVLYAFSAYYIAYYWNVMWIDGMILLPLILMGIERIIDDGRRPWLYTISLALIMISSYYMAFIIAIFSVLYFIFYYAGRYELTNPMKELKAANGKKVPIYKKIVNSRFLQGFLRCCFYALVAGALAAFALLPVYFTLKGSSATSDSFPTGTNTYFNFFDFLAQHFASLEPTIRSSGDPVLPNVYCGIITIMLATLYFYVPSISLKEKASRVLLIAVMYFSFNFNSLNFIWHGFHFPNDLPYRQSFTYIFLLICLAAQAMKHIKEIRGKDILTVSLLAIVFLAVAEKVGSKSMTTGSIAVSIIFIVLYAIVISLMNNKQYKKNAVAALLLCCMFSEVIISTVTHYEIDQPISNYTGNYEEFQSVKEYIDEKEGSENYRMEITAPKRIMEPSWYGYRGISEFSSMAYEKTSNLQYNLGLKSNYVNSYTYHLQTPVYNAMFGLKYIVNNDTENYTLNENYFSKIGHTETMDIYKNKYSLPICYAVNQDLLDWNYYSSNPFTIQNDFFKRATGVDGVLSDLKVSDIRYSNLNTFSEEVSSGSYHFSKITEDEDASCTVTIPVEKTQNLYLYVRGTGVDEITVYNADGSYSVTQDVSEEYVLDCGVHKKGETLYVDVNMSNNSGNVEIYMAGMNGGLFQQGYNVLNDDGAMNITTWEDTEVSGTVTIGENEMLYTSINYDEGWTVYVDGSEVSSENLVKFGESLIGVKMEPGEHTVTFKFKAKGYREGLLISGVTLILILLFAVVIPQLKKSSGSGQRPPKKKKGPKTISSEQVQ